MKIKFLEAYEDGSVILDIDGHEVAGMVGKEYDIDFTTKKLEVKHMDFGDDDPNYDANMMEVKGN